MSVRPSCEFDNHMDIPKKMSLRFDGDAIQIRLAIFVNKTAIQSMGH